MSSKLLPLEAIQTVGLVGAGSVGSAWAALMLAAGYDVVVYDVDAAAEIHFREAVLAAWPAVQSLHPNAAPAAPLSRTRFVESIEDLASVSDLV
ncbi:MAG TPA: 3-hydroxyacyl-CoA dehydrogenase NAD-binding domain-containing protein, partial [Candidatus Sulfotelmatobacter sp.]|nr:3-hydroxyacyl-CoA dehydrogenase NAD-binding domain-containing protein [Candidatus Sulfotelmatobacter sp.]